MNFNFNPQKKRIFSFEIQDDAGSWMYVYIHYEGDKISQIVIGFEWFFDGINMIYVQLYSDYFPDMSKPINFCEMETTIFNNNRSMWARVLGRDKYQDKFDKTEIELNLRQWIADWCNQNLKVFLGK